MRQKKTFAQAMAEYKRAPLSLALRILVLLSAVLTIGALFTILIYILIKGVPNLKPELFALKYTTDNASMMPAIINTLIMTVMSLIFAVPVGIFSAIYLAEYAKRGSKVVKLIRMTAETLSGIPSIVYGLFGMLFFGVTIGWNNSMLSGALTLAIMILPLIMRTTEEALLSVPDAFREGSFGLGAGKLRTVFKIVLPYAMPGILSGVILGIGRVVGETAALIYTAGSVAQVPMLKKLPLPNLLGSGRTLAVHMYALLIEPVNNSESAAYATAVVLLVIVVLINLLSGWVAKKLSSTKG